MSLSFYLRTTLRNLVDTRVLKRISEAKTPRDRSEKLCLHCSEEEVVSLLPAIRGLVDGRQQPLSDCSQAHPGKYFQKGLGLMQGRQQAGFCLASTQPSTLSCSPCTCSQS